MMVRLFRQQRHAGHEGEGSRKVGKGEAAGDGVACFVMVPIGQILQRLDTLGFAQRFDHDWLPLLAGGRPAYARSMAEAAPLCQAAPDAAAIEAMARDTLARMPEPFAAHLAEVVLLVEDYADDETLAALGIEDPIELTGIYHGRPVGEKSAFDSGAMPDRIHLYRLPILWEWIETGMRLDELVHHVVVHEVGHHFGLSDDDMHALEDGAA